MRRLSFILLTAWAMIAAPSLCSGGVLAHHCAEQAEPEHESHDDHSDHESGCSIDPCNQDTIRQNDDESQIIPHEPLPLIAAVSTVNDCLTIFGPVFEPNDESPPRNLPYHLSDRPLLD